MVAEIVQQRIDVRGKVVVDFGAGSGVVVIAAKLAGAKTVYACEIDPVAISVIKMNCMRNDVEVVIVDSFRSVEEQVGLVLAADVLYESENVKFLDWFLSYASDVVVADSRMKNLSHKYFEHYRTVITTSFPDFKEAKANNEVRFYRNLTGIAAEVTEDRS
jgi:predicted nicotinamide N-methyase